MDDYNLNIPPEISKNLNKNMENPERICKKMFEELAQSDLDAIARRSSAKVSSDNRIKLHFFGTEVLVDIKDQKIYLYNEKGQDKKEFLDVVSSSMILHYLLNADGSFLEGRWVSYRELPNGLFYGQTIPGVLQPLASKFENSVDGFINKALEMGGKRTSDFSNGVIIYPFEMFPVILILDEKDDEFEANVRILFDSSAPHYFNTDIVKMVIIYIVNKFIS